MTKKKDFVVRGFVLQENVNVNKIVSARSDKKFQSFLYKVEGMCHKCLIYKSHDGTWCALIAGMQSVYRLESKDAAIEAVVNEMNKG